MADLGGTGIIGIVEGTGTGTGTGTENGTDPAGMAVNGPWIGRGNEALGGLGRTDLATGSDSPAPDPGTSIHIQAQPSNHH